jgi:hypothetical protein
LFPGHFCSWIVGAEFLGISFGGPGLWKASARPIDAQRPDGNIPRIARHRISEMTIRANVLVAEANPLSLKFKKSTFFWRAFWTEMGVTVYRFLMRTV